MKKEVSDHLAKMFFEVKPAQKTKRERSFFDYVVLSVGVLTVLVLAVTLIVKNKSFGITAHPEVLKLERYDGPHVLKFDFSKELSGAETLYVGLPDLDLRQYRKVGFNVRILEPQTRRMAALKVSIVSKRKEISSLYIRQINHSWKSIVIPFFAFGNVSDWSGIAGISFSLEPWNTSAEKGKLLIDDIQFLKN